MEDAHSEKACPYPFGETNGLDLHSQYSEFRSADSLRRVKLPFGDEAWMLTRYSDIRQALMDNRFSRAATLRRNEPRVGEEVVDRGLLSMDPPDHTRLRRIANAGLTPRQVEQLQPRTEEIADQLLDALPATGTASADIIGQFISPFAVMVVCELLGVPFEDRDDFQKWSQAVVATTSLSPEKMSQYMGELHAYMAKLISAHADKPTDSLLSGMIKARDEHPERLTEEELVLVAVRLLAPGVQNTVLMLANFVLVLMDHPREFTLLRERPDLVPAAIEELLRYTPFHTSTMFPRYALEDVDIRGNAIQAGDAIVGSICSANHDEAVFSSPDTLDFTRESNPHLAFGQGAHFCPGAHLARMQLQVAIGALARRMDDLQLAVPKEELSWKEGMVVRWLDQLPVSWSRIKS